LPRPVRPHDPDQLALVEPEAHVMDRPNATKALRDPLNFEQGHAGLAVVVRRAGARAQAARRFWRPRAWLAGRRCSFGAGLASTPHPPRGVARGHPTVGGLLAPLRTSAAPTARHEARTRETARRLGPGAGAPHDNR